MTDHPDRVEQRLAALTITEKCRLLGGASNWRTHAIDRVGIPAVKMTDGPNGARGEFTSADSTPAVVLPVGIAQGATWDPALVGRLADLLGREVRRRTAHVLLAPGVNLQRTPVGGRTFEYFSEDPELTAAYAVAIVRAVQAHDVAVTVKHFAGNDTEIDRLTVTVDADERVLRELYLRPFEAAVREGGAWGVMSAYNRLGGPFGGDFCAANRRLLTDVLRDEWGFDGFVVSDWFGAHEPAGSLRSGLDLEMPGPARVYGERLEAAVTAGEIDPVELDDGVRRLLELVERTRVDERPADDPEASVDDPAERALCREAAAAGTVLARNEREALPFAGARLPRSVALIGPNAAGTRIMGGGSSALRPLPHRSIRDALSARLPGVRSEMGCRIDKHTPFPPAERLLGPDGETGFVLSFVNGTDPEGPAAASIRLDQPTATFVGSAPPGVGPGPCVAVLQGTFVAETDGEHEVGVIVTGRPEVRVGGRVVIDADTELPEGDAFYGYGSAEHCTAVVLQAGERLDVSITLPMRRPFGAMRIGVREPGEADNIARAVALARDSEAAVVVVGTNDDWETEGHDRASIALPGDQDELVRRIAEVNDRTIVVVNAGSPVAMPWLEDVAAVVLPFFGGLEMADAVVDVLLGEVDPGGRLPISFPARLEDAPAWAWYEPVDGVQRYGEGFGIGYRGHDRSGVAPLLPFGHGLSYGEVVWGAATAGPVAADGSVTVEVPLHNPGHRPCTVVVQGYVAPVDPPVEREPKALRAWHKLVVESGASSTALLRFGPQAFRRWCTDIGDWVVDPGDYDLVVGASATDLRAVIRVGIG